MLLWKCLVIVCLIFYDVIESQSTCLQNCERWKDECNTCNCNGGTGSISCTKIGRLGDWPPSYCTECQDGFTLNVANECIEPTTSPTAQPTVPTLKPSSSPTSAPTLKPSTSPTFSLREIQQCGTIHISEEDLTDHQTLVNKSTFSLSNATFDIVNSVGMNDHLYWEYSANQNATYTIYYDVQWKINIEKTVFVYVRNTTESQSYPPLDSLTIWNSAEKNYSITLHLSCLKTNENNNDSTKKALEYTSFIVVGILLLLAILLVIIVFIVHRKKKGSDRPGYISVIRCFIEIIDLYTDISFTYSVYLSGNPWIWYLVPFSIIAFAYLLSMIIALYKINTYKKNSEPVISNYMKSFDKLWLTLTLIVGFYATFDLLSSHIFHLAITSFQVPKYEKNNMKTLRIVNFVIIENLGMLVIQTMYLFYSGYFNDSFGDHVTSDIRITLLAMSFSIIAILSGLLTVISRLIHCCSSKSRAKQEYFYMDITSKHINTNHVHSHFLLSLAISRSIKMDRSSVEVLNIVQKTKGIHCKVSVNVCNHHDMENYKSLFHILFNASETKKSLKKEIKSILMMPAIKDVSIERIKQQGDGTKVEMEQSVRNGEQKQSKCKNKSKAKSKSKKKKQKNDK